MAPTKSTDDSKNRTAGKLKSAIPNLKGAGNKNSLLEDFFYESLKDIYWAEKQLIKALPRMQKAATTSGLKSAIEEHIAQTREQVARLDEIFQLLEKKALAKKCEAMEGLIKEGESIVEETETGTVTRDVGIIMAAQKIEHYEIATYGGLIQLATVLGEGEIAKLLSETLKEEKETDVLLSEIAMNKVNWNAGQEDVESQ